MGDVVARCAGSDRGGRCRRPGRAWWTGPGGDGWDGTRRCGCPTVVSERPHHAVRRFLRCISDVEDVTTALPMLTRVAPRRIVRRVGCGASRRVAESRRSLPKHPLSCTYSPPCGAARATARPHDSMKGSAAALRREPPAEVARGWASAESRRRAGVVTRMAEGHRAGRSPAIHRRVRGCRVPLPAAARWATGSIPGEDSFRLPIHPRNALPGRSSASTVTLPPFLR